MSTPAVEITNIEIDREAMALRLTWDDGFSGSIGLVEVRLACPCANCRVARDNGEASWPGPASPTPLGVRDAQLSGAWGLSITWNDGHDTGIYPFTALRTWCEVGHPTLMPDSGLGGV